MGASAQLDAQEAQAWKVLQNSIVYLDLGTEGKAVAAYVGQDGLFIAQRNVVTSSVLSGRRVTGERMTFTVVSRDAPSQLVLLRAESGYGDMLPVKSPPEALVSGRGLLAVLATGPIRAELSSSQRIGVLSTSRRLIPLNEIRFETPNGLVGNALVFTREGNFVGAIYATLTSGPTKAGVGAGIGDGTQTTKSEAANVGGARNELRSKGSSSNDAPKSLKVMGPMSLVVAYTPAADITAKAFSGFLSDDHTPRYASLGVMCKDALGGGALVQSVEAGSSAAKAGLAINDVITSMGGYLVRNQIDFAKALYRLEAGKEISIQVNRIGTSQSLKVTLGAIKIQ